MPEATIDTRRPCPVCGARHSEVFIEENIDPAKVSSFSFASRKLPEYMCHRLVRCLDCDLVYADEPPPAEVLAQAYHQADFDSSQEADDAAAAYIAAARPLLARLPQRAHALEIGTGSGIFLDLLRTEGFAQVTGVEPSLAAIQAAPAERQRLIVHGVFREQDFAPASFDLICCFMTLEHVRDPAELVQSAMRLLRPGGAFMAVVHDYRSGVNRLLGRRSPIIDIEHMQLFSRGSVARLLAGNGYEKVAVRSFANRYAMNYWLRLAPLPAPLKHGAAAALRTTGVGRIKLAFNVGNLFAAGFKPV